MNILTAIGGLVAGLRMTSAISRAFSYPPL
nr:MAG TPA: hypothetical protein [Caudoviricetes sp.]